MATIWFPFFFFERLPFLVSSGFVMFGVSHFGLLEREPQPLCMISSLYCQLRLFFALSIWTLSSSRYRTRWSFFMSFRITNLMSVGVGRSLRRLFATSMDWRRSTWVRTSFWRERRMKWGGGFGMEQKKEKGRRIVSVGFSSKCTYFCYEGKNVFNDKLFHKRYSRL